MTEGFERALSRVQGDSISSRHRFLFPFGKLGA
jgi:hypothetical protein